MAYSTQGCLLSCFTCNVANFFLPTFIAASMFEKFKRNLLLSRYFRMEFLWLEIRLKLDNFDVQLLSGENQVLLK